MMHFILITVQTAAAFGMISSSIYYLLCLWSAAAFLRERDAGEGPFDRISGQVRPASNPPPVSILKPLKGTDPEMYESFRSHCSQDYPEYEILLPLRDTHFPYTTRIHATN